MSKSLWGVAILVGASLFCSASARAQEPAKDDALDKLLEKLDKPKAGDDAKPGETKPAADQEKKADTGKKPEPKKEKDELESKDKDLDSLLEKLGETEDAPSAKGKPQPGPTPGGPRPKRPGDDTTGGLKGQTKDLDEHLEELTGRKKKKRDQQNQQKPQDGGGPLTEAIKKMEEVEKRLSKTDTGEATRKTQEQIVKQLDTILEQLRQSSSQSQSRSTSRRIQQAGNKNGSMPGQDQNQGNAAAGVGPSKSLRPNGKSSLANSKDTWGDLPPHLREEMENVFKEEMLPAKRLLIERYYLSLTKKSRGTE